MTEAQVTTEQLLQRIEDLESRLSEVERIQEERAVDFLTQDEYSIQEASKYLLLVHGIDHTVNVLYSLNYKGRLTADTEKYQPIRYKRETLDEYARKRADYRNPKPPVISKQLKEKIHLS